MKRSMTMTHSWVSSDNQWRGIICWCCQLKIAKGNLLAKPHAGHFVCVRLSRLNTHKPHFSILRLWPTFGTPMHRKTGCHTLELKGIYTAKFFVLLLLSFVCGLLWPAERTVQNHRASRSHQSSFCFFFSAGWCYLHWGSMSAEAQALWSLARDMWHTVWGGAGRTLCWQLELGRS